VGKRARMSQTPPGNPLFISDVDLCHTRVGEVAYVARRSGSSCVPYVFYVSLYNVHARTLRTVWQGSTNFPRV
jgi:hypothetical protein